MVAQILDGLKLAKKIQKKIKKIICKRKKNNLIIPGLAIILIGNNTSSKIYIKNKKIACNKVGFLSKIYKFSEKINKKKIISIIKKLNNNKLIHGILIQLPLPNKITTLEISKKISYKKDVDGFHPLNMGLLCQRNPNIRSCTPLGIINLLKEYKIKIKGMNALIIGASNIVGRPMMLELLLAGCTTTITHRFTKNLYEYVKKADLIIIAIGKPNFLHGKWIKKGAIIIDVGINRLENGKIVGDVNFKSMYKKASYITPVPGGVGPMTITSLLQNTLYSFKKYQKK
ncbi:MAG: bifunctional methylenetetrahydrofolate dehydrogenase/methenyltetrahydrofolate cyclohydrolase FolD [Buchnera aphidicola (Periphyllus lyropictus)]|uniref:bifunctional methylenetetrahydrofolate dehydrogenase/methenyltetrahydrofolate cyclohydrolase FolD n=1 Tax=Buchnera aphidicola TaxID=9 RepID=UPI001ED20B72|nr:bifunctional methylenetetrahydrofolate dehydrogenase/methenyltetrahydrofolate cyclohydrolase FolD [Buchnera aphidicola]NIH16507.1 bifunctional methylenetetrahydrofolate dehydrogenase/methenyltetrahydrofolate cyclohydrolase FolD [Buchnera aphidicola (Periphyllus lyropictus)]USS94792.1 bifunctional methylenetetrahydrofolate dehydrogenase/methenyltetrahydrofolate cyclohydrolase FolD [Buchnera aphidicola (Periphyllus lyropictus)]